MERMTYSGDFCDIAMCAEVRGGKHCKSGACSQKKVWDRLYQIENQLLCQGNNFNLVVISAVRYAIGRRTYMPSAVCEFALAMMPYLDNTTLTCTISEIDTAERENRLGDEGIDAPHWCNLRFKMKEELKEREKKNE